MRCAVTSGDIESPKTLTLIDYSRPSTEPRLWVYDMATGKPKPGTKIVASKPDAVNFKTGTILDDKPAGDIGQHREQLFRYIRAYKEATGQMPKEIIIEFYTPQTFEPAGRLRASLPRSRARRCHCSSLGN